MRRSRRTGNGSRSRCRRALKRTTRMRSRRSWSPADGSAAPRRITHEGSSVASPRWTDDNLLQYSLNASVNSAVFVGGACTAAAHSAGPQRCSRSRSMTRTRRRCGDDRGAGRAERRRQVARAGARDCRARRRAEVTRHRLREAACIALQGPHLRLDALPAGRPGLSDAGSAHAARRRDRDHRRRRRPAEDDHDARHARRERRVASERHRRSRSPPTTAGRTSRPTSSPTSTP